MDERSSTRWLLLAGVIGPVLFVVVLLVEGWTRPGYDPQRMYGSLLSLGDQGWQQIANFLVSGALFIAAAIGWRRSMPDGPGCRWVPILVGLAGIGLMLAGVFVTDPSHGYPPGTPAGGPLATSWHGAIHDLASVFVFLGLPVAMFIMARRFRGEGSRWSLYSLASGVGVLLAFFAMVAFADVLGVMQRVAIVIAFGWVARVSWRFRAQLGS
jgi:hypothetical membrane protein